MVKSHASPDTTRFRVVVAIVAFGTLAILFASSRQGEEEGPPVVAYRSATPGSSSPPVLFPHHEESTAPPPQPSPPQQPLGRSGEYVFRGTPLRDLESPNATRYLLRNMTYPCELLLVDQGPDQSRCRWEDRFTIPPSFQRCNITRVVCDAMPEDLGGWIDKPFPALTDTYYRYIAMCPASRCYTSRMLHVKGCGRNHTPWAVRYATKNASEYHGPRYLAEKEERVGYLSEECMVLGVRVSVTTADGMLDITLPERKAFALNEFRYFISHVMIFGAFDVDEYRVVVTPLGHIKSENELGLLYPPTEIRHELYWLGEKQSHEIAHAWVGGHFMFSRQIWNQSVGLLEGLCNLMGSLGTHDGIYEKDVKGNILQYWDENVAKGKDLPLRDMGAAYAGTRNANLFYGKGCFVFGILGMKMNAIKPKAFCLLMRAFMEPGNRIEITYWTMKKMVSSVLSGVQSRFDFDSFLAPYYNESVQFSIGEMRALVGAKKSLRDCPPFE